MKRFLLSLMVSAAMCNSGECCDKCRRSNTSSAAGGQVSFTPASGTLVPVSTYVPASAFHFSSQIQPVNYYTAAPASYYPAGYFPVSYGYAPASVGFISASGTVAPAGFLNWLGTVETGVNVVRDNACPYCRALGCCHQSGEGSDRSVDATTNLIARVRADLEELQKLKTTLDELGDLFNKPAPKPKPSPEEAAEFSSDSTEHIARLDQILNQLTVDSRGAAILATSDKASNH